MRIVPTTDATPHHSTPIITKITNCQLTAIQTSAKSLNVNTVCIPQLLLPMEFHQESGIQPCNLGSRAVQPPRRCSGWAKQRIGVPPLDDHNLCNWLLAFIKLHHALGLWICWIWCNHTDWQTSHEAVVNTQEEPRKTTNCNHRHQLPTHIQQLVWHPSWRQLPVTTEQVDNTSSNHSEDPSNNNGSISSSSNFTMASSTKDESCFITN